jgi:Tol biopolymer transport system component
MNQSNDLDQMLATWTDDLYAAPTERILGKVLERTTRTKQRRSWASLERWLPMAIITRPAAAAPSLRFAWILIAALLAVALVAGGAIVASRLHLAAVDIPQGDSAVLVFGTDSAKNGELAGDIYTARADGGDLRHITSGPAFDSNPIFSPDGTRIAFHRWENGTDSLVVMDAGGGNPVTLAASPANSQDCLLGHWTVAWSPDGQSLVFPTRENCMGSFDLNIVAADGSSPATKLLADGTNSVNGAWSPDGNRLAFIGSVGTGTSGLYVADVPTGGALAGGFASRQIASNLEWNLSTFSDPPEELDEPHWSPDGTQIAVTSVTKGHFLEQADGILIVNADGSGQRTLTTRAGNPAWSPNGEQLVFQRTVDPSEYANGRPCTVRTWIVNQDGSNEHMLPDLGDNCGLPPRWSPDGTRIASVLITPQGNSQDPLFHFAVVKVDGSSAPVILGDAYGSWQPVAAPLPTVSSPSPS